jgi:hypothetical protein
VAFCSCGNGFDQPFVLLTVLPHMVVSGPQAPDVRVGAIPLIFSGSAAPQIDPNFLASNN